MCTLGVYIWCTQGGIGTPPQGQKATLVKLERLAMIGGVSGVQKKCIFTPLGVGVYKSCTPFPTPF